MKLTAKAKMVLGLAMAEGMHAADRMTEAQEDRLLRAIAEVETGTTDVAKACRKVGRHGERSAWQLMESTWRSYTRAPFAQASTRAEAARHVARLHLRWLATRLAARNLPIKPYWLALAWNGGPNVSALMPPTRPADYALRVEATEKRIFREENQDITITPAGEPGKVWLQDRSGEAGAFPAQEVARVMDDAAMLRGYFNANF